MKSYGGNRTVPCSYWVWVNAGWIYTAGPGHHQHRHMRCELMLRRSSSMSRSESVTVNQEGWVVDQRPSSGTHELLWGTDPAGGWFLLHSTRETGATSHHPPFNCPSVRPGRWLCNGTRNTPPPCGWGGKRVRPSLKLKRLVLEHTTGVLLYKYKYPWRVGLGLSRNRGVFFLLRKFVVDPASERADRRLTAEGEMAQGTLEVLLVGARGLENTDYLSTYACLRSNSSSSAVSLVYYKDNEFDRCGWSPGNMDPYALLQCRSHEQKSSVASGIHLLSLFSCCGLLLALHIRYFDLVCWNYSFYKLRFLYCTSNQYSAVCKKKSRGQESLDL